MLGHPLDLAWHRRREQHGLPVLRRVGDDPFDRGRKAHVEHTVSFVEDEDSDAPQVDRAPLYVVDQPAGSCDDDVRRVLERADLRVHRRTADEQSRSCAEAPVRLFDLLGQLARRRDDQTEVARLEASEHRNNERERLARASLCDADDVVAVEQRRDCLLLDGSGRRKAEAFDALEKRIR